MKNPYGGIYYEINRNHPMVEQILNGRPELKQPLFALFRQIEGGLPLNQLYVDLNNDEQLINDKEQDSSEIVASLNAMLGSCSNAVEKLALLSSLSQIEPFSSYTKEIEQLKKELSDG